MAEKRTRQLLPDVNGNDSTHFTKQLMPNICDFYDGLDFIDVTFKLSNPTALVPAHRLILSAASPYFKDFFKSDKSQIPVIEFNGIDSDIFERLMTFCYTGKVLITIDNVDAMLKAAMILQLDGAVVSCVDYILEHMTEYTLKRTYYLELEIQCPQLNEKLLEYETNNFIEVSQSTEFLNFSAAKLKTIIKNDNLNVRSEEDVFHAVKRWYEYDSKRQLSLPYLIGCLRLTQIDVDFLMENVEPLPGCGPLVHKAISWITLPTNRTKLSLNFTKPRESICNKSKETTFLAVREGWKDTPILQYDKTKDEWQKYDTVKYDFERHRVILLADNLIFIGGYITNVVKSWSIKTKTWRTLPSMIQSRSMPSVVLLDSKIYAIGGETNNGKISKSMEMYSAGNEWKFVRGMSTPRVGAGAVVLNGKIFVMGGFDGTSNLKSVECYDPSSNTWEKKPNMCETHNRPGVAVHKGCIYVLGGLPDDITVERYDSQINHWTKICSLSEGRGWMGCVFEDDQLWVIGGEYKGYWKNIVSIYYAEYDEWVEKKRLSADGPYSCFVVPKALLQSE